MRCIVKLFGTRSYCFFNKVPNSALPATLSLQSQKLQADYASSHYSVTY
jgi:hypothetical protein